MSQSWDAATSPARIQWLLPTSAERGQCCPTVVDETWTARAPESQRAIQVRTVIVPVERVGIVHGGHVHHHARQHQEQIGEEVVLRRESRRRADRRISRTPPFLAQPGTASVVRPETWCDSSTNTNRGPGSRRYASSPSRSLMTSAAVESSSSRIFSGGVRYRNCLNASLFPGGPMGQRCGC